MRIEELKKLLEAKEGDLEERTLKKRYEKLKKAREKFIRLLIQPRSEQETDFPERKPLSTEEAEEVKQIINLFFPKEKAMAFIERVKKNIDNDTKRLIMHYFNKINSMIEKMEDHLYEKQNRRNKNNLSLRQKLVLARIEIKKRLKRVKTRMRKY